MFATASRFWVLSALAAALAACGGGSSTASPPIMQSQSGSVPLLLSDASSEDWATIGVKILSVALVPQGGGSAVTVYTAPSPAPVVNLVQLDRLGEILGNVTVPVGTYAGAILTVSGNAGDVLLMVAADPEAGFAASPGATIPADQIQIQGTQGTAPNLTVPVKVAFASNLVVTTSQNNALDLEFELGHPAFIIGHVPPGAGMTLWAVNFNGPVRHHPIHDLTRLVLRHVYGNVSAVSTDNSSITITRDFPTLPVVTPETAVATTQSLQIQADATNGTIFYDVDAKTRTVIKDFSTEAASLVGKYVRVAARYQDNGTLIAVRVWASSAFNSVWLSPEGHVLHVDDTADVITVANESGTPVRVGVDANTQFFFRTPQSALADATPIGTGTAFLTNQNLVRGFKVHVSVVDPLATPLVAQTVDIETAMYDGRIFAANTTGFVFTRNFRTAGDDYTHTLDYIANTSANGVDANGNPITGFKWWNFTYPTLLTSGANAISDFVAATHGGVDFGGTVGSLAVRGVSYASWNDPANPDAWTAPWTVLLPTPLPLGTVSTGIANNMFGMTVAGGTMPVTVDISTTVGSATLVFQFDRTKGVVSVSPIDITTSAGLMTLTNGLQTGTPIKVYGVPQADGTLKSYVLAYYTGDQPAQ